MTATDAQSDWIARVLGVRFGGGGRAAPGPDTAAALAQVRKAWDDAAASVDAQIAALRSVLQTSGDEELEEIAGSRLDDITQGRAAKLLALLSTAQGSPVEVAGPSARDLVALIDEFQAFVASDVVIATCDRNPFKVRMSIKATLTKAFAEMRRSLAAATAQA